MILKTILKKCFSSSITPKNICPKSNLINRDDHGDAGLGSLLSKHSDKSLRYSRVSSAIFILSDKILLKISIGRMIRSSKISKILKNNRRQKKHSDKSFSRKDLKSDIVSPLLNPRTIMGENKTQNPKVIIENAQEESDDYENMAKKISIYGDFKRSFDRFDDIRRNRVRKCGHFPDSSFESSTSEAETSAQTSESETRNAESDKKERSRLSTVHLLTPSSHETASWREG
uniref:Uncharacterized protein n=1 Tax=Romanomermis culicivorax TaxID=13658 RepID=A0A915KSK4_ROMCU